MNQRPLYLAGLLCLALYLPAQEVTLTSDQIKALTPDWKGERFADGRPKTSDLFLNRLKNVSLEEALKPDVLLVHTYDDRPLPKEHGGPCRMITPQLYAWKGSKWIRRIEFMTKNKLGFWEERGYSNTAYPWRNDRYSE